MVRPRLAAWLASTCLVVACANGGAGDDGTADFDSGIGPVEASAGHDSSSSGSASHPDSGGSSSGSSSGGSADASSGNDASSGDDAGSTADGTTGNDSGSGPETGTTQDSGSGQDTGTTSGGMCGSGSKYGIEAAAEIASGHITLCLTGTCSPGFCCYPVISPGDVCVQE